MLNILALDMACGEIAACVLRGNQPFLASTAITPPHGKMRSTTIVPAIQTLLDQAELDWTQLHGLVFGSGPGAFTGLRIAAATLAGINAGLHLPVRHISSLAITARQTGLTGQQSVHVLEDARAGEVFSGCYQNGNAIKADTCMGWDTVTAMTPGLYCCHTEPPCALQQWTRIPLTLPRSEALALLVQSSSEPNRQLTTYPAPVYLQLSQAERNLHAT